MIFYDCEEERFFFNFFLKGVEHLYFSYDSKESERVGQCDIGYIPA